MASAELSATLLPSQQGPQSVLGGPAASSPASKENRGTGVDPEGRYRHDSSVQVLSSLLCNGSRIADWNSAGGPVTSFLI